MRQENKILFKAVLKFCNKIRESNKIRERNKNNKDVNEIQLSLFTKIMIPNSKDLTVHYMTFNPNKHFL